ncbi:MAG TPA: hypothetical protein VF388_01535 [Lacunisphaera sp.]
MMRLRLFMVLVVSLVISGCGSAPSPLDQPLIARFYLEAKPGVSAMPLQMPVSRTLVNVNPQPVLTEHDIANVEFAKVALGWCLYFQFNPAATRDLYRLTSANPGARLVLTLNDTPVGVRPIDQIIADGNLLTFVELPNDQLPPIAERLKRTSAALAKKGR